MINQNEIDLIKNITEDFFRKATVDFSQIEVSYLEENQEEEQKDVVNLKVALSDPQILIGEKGQTLFEVQRILKMILNKKLSKPFYINLDINNYKEKKADYLISIAKDLANEVAITKESKELIPMSAYERRIIHAELSNRDDVITKSSGEGQDRHIIIEPK